MFFYISIKQIINLEFVRENKLTTEDKLFSENIERCHNYNCDWKSQFIILSSSSYNISATEKESTSFNLYPKIILKWKIIIKKGHSGNNAWKQNGRVLQNVYFQVSVDWYRWNTIVIGLFKLMLYRHKFEYIKSKSFTTSAHKLLSIDLAMTIDIVKYLSK